MGVGISEADVVMLEVPFLMVVDVKVLRVTDRLTLLRMF